MPSHLHTCCSLCLKHCSPGCLLGRSLPILEDISQHPCGRMSHILLKFWLIKCKSSLSFKIILVQIYPNDITVIWIPMFFLDLWEKEYRHGNNPDLNWEIKSIFFFLEGSISETLKLDCKKMYNTVWPMSISSALTETDQMIRCQQVPIRNINIQCEIIKTLFIYFESRSTFFVVFLFFPLPSSFWKTNGQIQIWRKDWHMGLSLELLN